jgi:protocatechuate 3,4-dioxygenase beta subunit
MKDVALVVLPHTLSEVTAPVFGYGDIKPADSDLTKQHKGERNVVSGRVPEQCGPAVRRGGAPAQAPARSHAH